MGLTKGKGNFLLDLFSLLTASDSSDENIYLSKITSYVAYETSCNGLL